MITAWGFEYKTHCGLGQSRAITLVIISPSGMKTCSCAPAGAARPDVHELEDSVRVIPRGEHSEKPEEFRLLIDKLYPTGPRIELFARSTHTGWDSWGNEVPPSARARGVVTKLPLSVATGENTCQCFRSP